MRVTRLLAISLTVLFFADHLLADLRLEHRGEYRLLFTTSQRRDATSTDIADYNEFVQSVADSSPGLARVGRDWLNSKR